MKTTPRRHVSADFPHIETKIHFLEIAVERDGQAKQACVEKEKADDAEKCFTIIVVELDAGRNKRREDRRIDNEIEHRKITPISSEEWLHGDDLNRNRNRKRNYFFNSRTR